MAEGPFYCDWGEGKGGSCTGWIDITDGWEPCCGEPCNGADGVKCAIYFWLTGPCSVGKMLATSVGQKWHVLNHCLYPTCCFPCAATCLRHNLRAQNGIGEEDWFGDAVMAVCCSYCSIYQAVKASKTEDWDWLADMQENGLQISTELKNTNDA
mmetsp:Transcript_19732/g.75665  ORF Transcript_19732/g.75665 Transcript_19732/m.75665 type:complete len:154 (+) Transcript_19732:181-642(+)|eukprot:CAMPEP_0114614494 /NCGR_PEP_ID=MMETSP0168-20121206/5685_1 /TAXON_ID=95228 ORGANISM="Vannella sp., Strain DIVA3 517/6/12" /NCGR_SAMPLE_ID=MMETSP0168 /ASSEMBLY_ACC=CAM_ASM_000044 /LENGTH=153 /DNA_ID=CAMNT_0001825549 /DNA_START=25 /DNA_END=486 /DNA_ORIENTATION=-